MQDVSILAQGLRPRGSPSHLALTMLRMLPSAWHHDVGVPESRMFRGSMPWPVLSPVNASALPLRAAPHDSGPMWFATPSLCDSFIHYISPALPAHGAPSFAVFAKGGLPAVEPAVECGRGLCREISAICVDQR